MMQRKLYGGLWRRIGKRRISKYIETLIRPHVIESSLDDAYKAMAADKEREALAIEWCNALA
jgi:hypothetical protein